MRNLTRAISLMAITSVFLLMMVAIVAAQPPPGGPPPPAATEDPNGVPSGPGGEAPPDNSGPPPGLPTAVPQQATAVTGPGADAPVVIQETPVTVGEPVTTDEQVSTESTDTDTSDNETLSILIRVRADLDILADSALDLGERPAGWSGLTSTDIDNPDLMLLTRLDLEILVGALLGASVRPAGWFGAVASTEYAIARDTRHDLEILADVVFESTSRPATWNGDDPLLSCGRATQALVGLLEINGLFTPLVDQNAEDYCSQVEIEASRFAEVNLLANPVLNGSIVQDPTIVAGDGVINSEFAVAFVDRGAVQRLGVIPIDTIFTPIGRSPAQFSNMMLVSGDDFEVFVDFQFTSITQDEFDSLPDVLTLASEPFCEADWCN